MGKHLRPLFYHLLVMTSNDVIKSAILDFHFFSGSQKITESGSILTVMECRTARILEFCKIKLKQFSFNEILRQKVETHRHGKVKNHQYKFETSDVLLGLCEELLKI